MALFILSTCYNFIYAKDTVTFAVIGDMPYSHAEDIALTAPNGKFVKAIQALNPSVLIHYGDFKSGGEDCTDLLMKERKAQMFALHPYRIVYTPGDNEWTDCDRKYLTESFNELERLDFIRKLFFEDKNIDLSRDIPNLRNQKNLPENSMWNIDNLFMGTLHIVGTNNGRVNILKSDVNKTLDEIDKRDDLNRVWLKQLFEKAKDKDGLVILFHADIYKFKGKVGACTKANRLRCNPYKNIRDDIKRMALSYKKPVLVVHGDTNAYCFNQQSTQIPNLWHFNGPGDYKVSDAAKIIFDPNDKDEPFKVTGLVDPSKPPLVCNYNR